MTNIELNLIRYLGHKLPNIPHASGVINRILKPIYLRKKRSPIECDVLGMRMELDASEVVDGNLIFCPHLYDQVEIQFLLGHLNAGDNFVDVGSHIGFYSLMASKRIRTGKILAIEADLFTFARLKKNISLNEANVLAINNGVSDKTEARTLHIHTSRNRGASSFLVRNDGKSTEAQEVQCSPLLHLLKKARLTKIKGMKLDIEGFEYKVLKPFLENADRAMYPRFIITEYFEGPQYLSTGNQISLLQDYGYILVKQTTSNRILVLAET